MSILVEKKTPRKWAAWTRQEEESFFNALRQVGKVRLYLLDAMLLWQIWQMANIFSLFFVFL
jgi:hypothetical protein